MLTLRLALRAIRWRAAASATVFAVAIVAILAATVGPIYLHAVDDAVLARHLTDASAYQRDVLVSQKNDIGDRIDLGAQVRRVVTEIGRDRLFAPPVWEEQVAAVYGGGEELGAQLASIQHLCVHLRMVRGRCLSGDSTGETLISANTAAAEHLTVGDTLTTSAFGGVAIRLRVVGVYRPIAPGGAFWQPWALFGFGQPPPLHGPPLGDASFVTPATLSSRLPKVQLTETAHLALRAGAVGYDDIGELRTTMADAKTTVTNFTNQETTTAIPAADMTTSLPTLLDAIAGETSLARTLVTVSTAQLALLAMLLLYAAVATTTTAQGPEVALAKLRGRRAGSVLAQSVAQPVALVLVAAPVAALLAWLIVRLLAARALGRPVDVAFPPAAFGVAALGVLGGVLAAVVAARRIVVTPVGALLRLGAPAPGSAIGLLVADAVTVTVAVAGLIELNAGGVLDAGKPNPLAVLAPTLLAAGAAVVALRLLPFVARRLARRTRDSPRLATFLAVRQLLRRPLEARAALLVAVAVSIATFAVAMWADARHNRSLRALSSNGAWTVLIVRPGGGVHDLRTAVDRADPGGHSMAVALTGSAAFPPLIAVDTARFASVAGWVPGNSSTPPAAVLRTLAGGRAAPVTLTGTRLRLHVDLTRHPRRPVQLVVILTEPSYAQAVRTVGPIVPGNGSYDVSLPSACARGCRVADLGLTADTANINIEALDTHVKEIDAVVGASIRSDSGWRPVPSFGDATRWRGDRSGPVAIGTAGGSLSLRLRQTPLAATWPLAVSAATPRALPAVVASERAALYPGNLIHNMEVVGLDDLPATADGVIGSVTLPQVGLTGTMVDFGAALAAMSGPASSTTRYQVWLSPAAPPDMAARLAHQHVYVQRTLHSSRYRAALDHSGPAFADWLFLASALAAIVLAIGATALARAVSVRRRGYELAALEAVGVPPRTLRRATAAEQGSVFAIGLLVGLGAGVVGSRLALPSTPVFVDASNGPPLVLGLPWALLAALAVGLVVVFAVVSVATARLVERAATPSQLRGAQQ